MWRGNIRDQTDYVTISQFDRGKEWAEASSVCVETDFKVEICYFEAYCATNIGNDGAV